MVSALGATTTLRGDRRARPVRNRHARAGSVSASRAPRAASSRRARRWSRSARTGASASSFAMRRADDRPQVLAAGIGAVAVDASRRRQSPSRSPRPSPASPPSSPRSGCRRSQRNGLAAAARAPRRPEGRLSPADLLGDDDGSDGIRGSATSCGRAVNSPARAATNFFADTPFSGQVNLLTTSSFDTPQQLFSADNLARNIAYLGSARRPATTPTGPCAARSPRRTSRRGSSPALHDPRGAASPLRRRHVVQHPALRRRQSARAARCHRRQPERRHDLRLRHVR